MIDFPLVDTHLHLWDPARLHYAWLDEVPAIKRRFDLEDYRQACGEVEVAKMVFLQCEADPAQAQQEADWIASLAEHDTRLQGIIPRAPLETGDQAREAVEKLAQNPLVKGVRRLIQSEPELDFCLQPDFIQGVQMLAEFGLSFDICITHIQLENTIQLVQQCPEVSFVLDHIGKPDIKGKQLDPWRAQMRQLAALPNVWCKVSGLVTEADLEQWQPADLRPYLSHVFETFGFDRVMYGGDWPVVVLASTLERWMQTLGAEVESCSASEKRKLFHDNGVAFYRLGQDV